MVDPALQPVLDRVRDARGFRCDAYKEACLKRRLAVRMRATGVHTFADYAAVLDRDPEEYDRLLRTLTISVTNFYRNPETWDRLRTGFLPALWAARHGRIAAWSAGCATGDEPYTVAMLLELEAERRGDTAAACSVIGTDVDEAVLRVAARGTYPEAAGRELPAALAARFLEPTGVAGEVRVCRSVRERVGFQVHDLVEDLPPRGALDLVICRNVAIYFDRAAQEQLFTRIADAMAPGGILVLGKTETLLGSAARDRFVLEDIRERVYRRP